MSTVVHRTSFLVLRSVNTPDFSPAVWLINPPGLEVLQAASVPVRYWNVDGDDLVEQDPAERAATDAALLPTDKEAKSAVFDARTDQILAEGIEFPASSGNFYTLSPAALKAFELQLDVGAFPFLWHSINYTGAVVINDAAQGDSLLAAAGNKLRAVMQAGEDLLQLIRDAATKAELDAIVDPR